MKKLALVACAIGALSLGGCAEFKGLFSSDPATASASVALLTTQAVVVVCDISALSNVAAQVEAAAQASASVTGTTHKILAGSAAACAGLGAIAEGTITAPAGSAVVQ